LKSKLFGDIYILPYYSGKLIRNLDLLFVGTQTEAVVDLPDGQPVAPLPVLVSTTQKLNNGV
jgi:hypothetical protein